MIKNEVIAMTDKRIFVRNGLILILLVQIGCLCCQVQASDSNCPEQTRLESVDKVLEKLKKTTTELKSYESHVEYLFTQPFEIY